MAKPAAASLPAGTLLPGPEITPDELQLAVRNHSMPLEALRYATTPLGLHYLLIHFDIPAVDASSYELAVGGHVRKPVKLRLDEIKSRPARTLAVTLECAGNGRARLSPRPKSQPWLGEAVGNAEWTGTPLAGILDEAGVREGAVDVVFTGMDRGIQGEIEQQYERSLSIGDANREEVLLAYAINGEPLTPQHGFPLRLIVPGWYGMTHVKWLQAVTVIDQTFKGYQQARAYHYRRDETDAGVPVTRMFPRALMIPPGVPDFMSRMRYVEPGRHLIEGRAWSGRGEIVSVELSDDGGVTWTAARLDPSTGPYAWRRWSRPWNAGKPGEYELCVRATDAAGNAQPLNQNWNMEGVQNNAVQRVRVIVGTDMHQVQPEAGSL
ncbi:MAG TPA: sulfite oxidase [Candidatus Dormibacteraeota bacterium]|nr:sulfite oxidase [Candidatus Dormibacteraeota bacterium]